MKKGKRNYKLFNIIRAIKSSGFLSYTVSFVVFLAVSIAGIIVNSIFIDKGDDRLQDISKLVISCISCAISIAGLVVEFIGAWRILFKGQLLNNKEYCDKIADSVSSNLSNAYKDSKYYWSDYKGQRYLISDTVNTDLCNSIKEVRISVNPHKHAKNKMQKEMLFKIVYEKLNQGKSIFNDKLVSLRTDILDGLFINDSKKDGFPYKSYKDKTVDLEKTDYYANLTTNDQIYAGFFKYDYSSLYCAKDLTVDSNDTLYDLSQSPAANIVGVSTLVITNDGYCVINRQNNNNDVNNDCFVPSGSGSSDFMDLKKCRKFEPPEIRENVKKNLKYKVKSEFKKCKKDFLKKIKFSLSEEYRNLSDDEKKDKKREFDVAETYYEKSLKMKNKQHDIKEYSKDMKRYTYNLNTFLTYGMVRELTEESHLYSKKEKGRKPYKKPNKDLIKQCMDNTFVCGYIRILDRGGKPDFFGITILDISKAELEKMFDYGRSRVLNKEIGKTCKIADYNEVCKQMYIPLDDLYKYASVDELMKDKVAEENKKLIEEKEAKENDDVKKIKCSLQIHCLFELVHKNKDEIEKRLKSMKKENDVQ